MYTIEPVSHLNRGAAVAALVESFMTDPLFKFIVPDDRQRRQWLPVVMAENVRHGLASGNSRVVVHEQEGVVGAMSAGRYPPSVAQNVMMMVRTTLLPRPWVPSLGPLMPIFTYMKIWEQMHYKEDHCFVYVIGMHPRHQGKGQGAALMRDLLAETGAEGVPVYLETQTESNVPFYEGLGLEVTEEHAPYESGPHTWGMIRGIPQRTSGGR